MELVTSDEVIGWFSGATTSRHPGVPAADDVWSLVEMVNAIRGNNWSTRDLKIIDTPTDQMNELDCLTESTDIEQALATQCALRDLYRHLPKLIEIYERVEIDALARHRLKELSSALANLFRDVPYLFELPKPGGQNAPWHVLAEMLRDCIQYAWHKTGRVQLSNKPNGPLVKVLTCALKAATGRNIPAATIATQLNRAKRTKRSGPAGRSRRATRRSEHGPDHHR